MNILDEDIGLNQRRSLESRKIHFRQIGVEIGRSGMKDRNEVIPLLHQLKRPTFFTLGSWLLSSRAATSRILLGLSRCLE
jgi:hypothetical protein